MSRRPTKLIFEKDDGENTLTCLLKNREMSTIIIETKTGERMFSYGENETHYFFYYNGCERNILKSQCTPIISIKKTIDGVKSRIRGKLQMMKMMRGIPEYLDNYLQQCKIVDDINEKRPRKIRRANFPESISETMASMVFYLRWRAPLSFCKSGDFIAFNSKVEVKCFSSTGASSFGPKEEWRWLVLVDARKYKSKIFTLHIINAGSDSDAFLNIHVSKAETMRDMRIAGKRPRKEPLKLLDDLKNHIVHTSTFSFTDLVASIKAS